MLLVRRSRLVAAARGRQPMGTVAKGTTRSAVHGLRSPATTALENKEAVEEEIDKGREQKQKMREQVEEKVDSEISSDSAHRKSTNK